MPNAQFCVLGPFFTGGALAGSAKLYHYAAGTSTLKNIWSDRAESTTLAQPFVADSQGIFAFFADGLYKFVVTDSSDVTLYTWDNVLIQDFLTPTFSEGTSITSASAIAVGPEIWAHVTGSTDIDTLSGTIPWVWLVFDGSLSLVHSASLLCPSSVDLTVQSGDVVLLLNEGSSVWRVGGQMANSLLVNRTDVSVVVSDSRTNSTDAPLTITSTTSGTPAAGIGTGILFRAESQDENPSDVGRAEFAFGDVGTGTEDSVFRILLRTAGAALAQAWQFATTTANNAILTHSNTAQRTYTFQDIDDTIIGRVTTDSLQNKTLISAVISPTSSGATTANVLYADSIVKGWARFNVAGTVDDSLNVSSVTDNGAGDWTVNWATDFADANYAWSGSIKGVYDTGGTPLTLVNPYGGTHTTAALQVNVLNVAGTAVDPTNGGGGGVTTDSRISVMAIGNQ